MFHFPSLASGTYGFSAGSRGFAAGGFPIRTSPGQSLLGGSPELIAACHVLRRLLTPGHPPCALIRLTTTQRMKEFRTPSRNRLSKNQSAATRALISILADPSSFDRPRSRRTATRRNPVKGWWR